MDTNGTAGKGMDLATAERIVGYLAGQEGIVSATVAGADGTLLGSRGSMEPAGEASLAGFICHHAAEVVSADDLRGMGKLVSESQFQQLAISGAKGDALVIALDGGCLLLSARPGNLATAAQSAAPVINRFGPAASGPQGG